MNWPEIGLKIRAHRQRLRLDQPAYWAGAGLNQRQMSEIERGVLKRPSAKVEAAALAKLAEIEGPARPASALLSSAASHSARAEVERIVSVLMADRTGRAIFNALALIYRKRAASDENRDAWEEVAAVIRRRAREVEVRTATETKPVTAVDDSRQSRRRRP